jgi:hypothetical protein
MGPSGPSQKLLNLIWDTGSSKFWAPSDSCTSCTGNKYDPVPSQLAGFYSVIDSNPVTTTYNDGSSFTGILVQDKVCVTLDPLTCANGIIWYNIKS